jgi:hypothetical protein
MQVQQIIEQHKKKSLKFVVIQCYHTLFIDEDLIIPGLSLCIHSKNWKVIGDRKINLKGLDGDLYLEPAEGNRGYD